jgi:hypothetical protein
MASLAKAMLINAVVLIAAWNAHVGAHRKITWRRLVRHVLGSRPCPTCTVAIGIRAVMVQPATVPTAPR